MALTEAQKANAEKNRKYWADREEEALKHYIKEEAEYDRQIQRIYRNMLDDIQTQINSFYGRYAAKEGISLAEAKKRVSKLDIEAYERKAKRYVKDKDFSDKANEEMRLYNATMKINRLEMLKANIGLETIAGHNELEKFMASILKGRTEAELARQAGILGKTIHGNSRLAHAIPNASFHSGTFSDRIWQYQDLMRADLEKLLTRGLIQGKNARALTADLRKYLIGDKNGKGATYNVERLMRTELARVQTEAQKQSFIRNGFEMYLFNVNGTCCPICEEASKKDSGHGKGVYLVKDMMPGDNAPPLHPHCRCSTSAYSGSREDFDKMLDFLANGGTEAEWEKMKAKGGKDTTKAKTAGILPANEEMAVKRKAVAEYMENLGAKVDEQGNVTLYHATSSDIAKKIRENGFKPTDAPINGGTGGQEIQKRVFFGYDKNWVADTWANEGSYEIMTIKVPAEYLHQFGQNKSEVVIEGTIKPQDNGIWLPDTLPTSTAWDRITVKRWRKKHNI